MGQWVHCGSTVKIGSGGLDTEMCMCGCNKEDTKVAMKLMEGEGDGLGTTVCWRSLVSALKSDKGGIQTHTSSRLWICSQRVPQLSEGDGLFRFCSENREWTNPTSQINT